MKSILDIGRTLEVLETLGVPVVGYGTDEFPSFFSRSSGVAVPMRADTPEEVAALMAATWGLGLGSGISIANPVPEQDEMAHEEIDAVIEQALADSEARGIHGKDITPYLLGRHRRAVRRAGRWRPTWPWCATTPSSARPSRSPTPRWAEPGRSGGSTAAPPELPATTSTTPADTERQRPASVRRRVGRRDAGRRGLGSDPNSFPNPQ